MKSNIVQERRVDDACGWGSPGRGDLKLNDELIKGLLFKQVERPRGLIAVKAINVFENRYRINLWVEYEEEGVTKRKIAASYFAVLDGEELRIRS